MTLDPENAKDAADKKWTEGDSSPHTVRFTIISADDFSDGPEPQWIIDNVLPEGDIIMITGVSGAAKTFFTLDMMASVALGIPWRGYDVKQGRVVYIAAEGGNGVRKRLKAYKKHYGLSFGNNFSVIADSPNLMQEDDIALAEDINRIGGAKVIVVDTLAQVTPGANENSSEDMGKALNRCKFLRKATGALIALIHHVGKDETRGARGWSGMKAAMDTEIEIKRDNDKRYATITKQKDGEDSTVFAFKLESVIIGQDAKGKEITSCIVKHLEEEIKFRGPGPKGKWQEAVYKSLSASGIPIPVEHVIDDAIKSEPYDPGTSVTPVRDRRRESARRGIGEMVRTGLVKLGDNKVWIPQTHNVPQV